MRATMDEERDTPVGRLGAWIEEARVKWRWSRRTIERRSGLSDRTQYAIEKGERETLVDETINGICEAFGLDYLDIDRIMRGEEVPVPDRPPVGGAPSPSPRNGEGEAARLWDEVTDLRRRLVELDARYGALLNQLADRIEAVAEQLLPRDE